MLKKLSIVLFLAALATTIVHVRRGDQLRAQAGPDARQSQEEIPAATLKPAQKLPITQVVLFNSGVGYFHRSGEVEGDTRIDLQFSAADINDLIKSLIVYDAKGKSLPMRYDSQEPIEKTLKSFAIDLSANPSYGLILNQMRGQKVEIALQTSNPALNGLPASLVGTIVGMESSIRPHSPSAPASAEMELLNLVCAEGLRSVPLTAIQKVRFLNPNIENELRRALEVVAVGRDTLKRTVRLGFKGEGKREVRVGYVVDNPIWKTSYRLVKGETGKWRLQAWANVENTSDEDWTNIKLSLVSSRPISFQMDLYPPLFVPRPIVEPALFAALRPPTYAGPISNSTTMGRFDQAVGDAPAVGGGGGFNGLGGQVMQGGGGALGFGGGNVGQYGGGLNRFSNPTNGEAGRRLTFEEMQERRIGDQSQTERSQMKASAQQIGNALTNVDPDFVEQVRAADELGHPSRFTIDQKVILPRQESILLPILDEEIDATNVSIFNQEVHSTRPLLGVKIKNKTKQALMSGPVTVYQGEAAYSGDARMLDLQPNEERYLSFALDTGVEIKPIDSVRPSKEMSARIHNGQLTLQYKLRQTRKYVIVNRAPEDRVVVLEQPIQAGWKLVLPEKPAEQTTEMYRFEVKVKAGETVRYEVGEELPRLDPFKEIALSDWNGFETMLGLNVWTEMRQHPEDSVLMQVIDFPKALQVTHKDRRTTTYFFRNLAEEDRVVWFEHIVPADRALIGDDEPVEKGSSRYRFRLDVKKGQTASKVVSEERRVARPELIGLLTLAGYPSASPGADDGPAERFVTKLGFDVWQTRKILLPELVSGRFVKGELHTAAREVETATYHIRNRASGDRTFLLEHPARPNWALVDAAKPPRPFLVKAAGNQRVSHTVSEERIVSKKEPIAEVSGERLKTLLSNPSLKRELKDGLQNALKLQTTLEQTISSLNDLRTQVQTIAEEQARLRTNMDKLPPTSELYKRYLSKLDEQETALERIQELRKGKEAEAKSQKHEFDGFLERLNVE